MAPDREQRQSLPTSAQGLCGARDVARFLTRRLVERKPALLLRYGDTSGRILAQAATGKPDAYVRHFLGSAISPGQLAWFAEQLEQSLSVADVVGLRSDLLGPMLPEDVLTGPPADILPRLAALYPLRPFERTSLKPDAARRLAQTRRAMEAMALPARALLTDAWIHVGLLETGFFSAIFRHAPTFAVCTSLKSRAVLQTMATALPDRLRFYECPRYPWEEAEWGGEPRVPVG